MAAWTPEPAELAAARDAWRRLAVVAAQRGPAQLDLFVDVAVARPALDAGGWPAVDPETTATVAAVEALVQADAWPAVEIERVPPAWRRALLESAGGFLAPRHAPALARALEALDLVPLSDRLAALLVRVDAGALAARLVERLRRTPGAEGTWLASLAAARFAAHDDSRPAPPGIERAFAAVLDGDAPVTQAERLDACLRWEARRDPVAALGPLAEAVFEHGASDLPDGLRAVLARAAGRERAAVERFLEALEWLGDRALALAASFPDPAIGAPPPRLAERALALADELVATRHPVEAGAHSAWDVSLALLELAAGWGYIGVAQRALEAGGPPLCGAFLATWGASRRRALRDGRVDVAWLAALQPCAPGRAAPRAHVCGPLAAFDDDALLAWLRLKTLPLPELPWWSAREGGLP